MANLQIKRMDDKLYGDLKRMAAEESRSISQQTLVLIKEYISRRGLAQRLVPPAQVLLDLSGSWLDGRDAEAIIAEIKRARKNSARRPSRKF